MLVNGSQVAARGIGLIDGDIHLEMWIQHKCLRDDQDTAEHGQEIMVNWWWSRIFLSSAFAKY